MHNISDERAFYSRVMRGVSYGVDNFINLTSLRLIVCSVTAFLWFQSIVDDSVDCIVLVHHDVYRTTRFDQGKLVGFQKYVCTSTQSAILNRNREIVLHLILSESIPFIVYHG